MPLAIQSPGRIAGMLLIASILILVVALIIMIAIGWSVLWLGGGLAGVGAPGILFIMPAVIGIALLLETG